MTNLESENAQAAREIASLSHDDDPQPGAFYGLPIREPNGPYRVTPEMLRWAESHPT